MVGIIDKLRVRVNAYVFGVVAHGISARHGAVIETVGSDTFLDVATYECAIANCRNRWRDNDIVHRRATLESAHANLGKPGGERTGRQPAAAEECSVVNQGQSARPVSELNRSDLTAPLERTLADGFER